MIHRIRSADRALWMSCIALTVATVTSSGRAALIIGNLSSYISDYNSSTIGESGDAGKVLSFTMGDTAYSLTSATVRLKFSTDVALAKPIVELWAVNSTGTPIGSALITFTNPTFTNDNTFHNYLFAPAAAMTLGAHENYALVVRNADGADSNSANDFSWGGHTSTSAKPTGDATHLHIQYGTSASPTSWTAASSWYNWYDLNGTAIPEPATLALLGLGGLLLGRSTRRR